MDKVLKQKWVDALRCGDYKQGSGHLRRKRVGQTFHCCLGVLCEILAKEPKAEQFAYDDSYMGLDAVLPPLIQEKYDIKDFESQYLITANDNFQDFNQIADYIEENM